jgi:hypothetical protein
MRTWEENKTYKILTHVSSSSNHCLYISSWLSFRLSLYPHLFLSISKSWKKRSMRKFRGPTTNRMRGSPMFPALSKHQMAPLCHFSHWNPKTTNNNYYEQKETSNQKYLQRQAFPPLSESVSLRFSSSLLQISSLYIRSHLYSLSWKEETSDQTSRHATHEYSVFPQPIVLHTVYSTHLPYPVTFKNFISKVMFCVTFRKRFLVRLWHEWEQQSWEPTSIKVWAATQKKREKVGFSGVFFVEKYSHDDRWARKRHESHSA